MFEVLGNRFRDIFAGIRGEVRLTPAAVEAALREIRLALLEADVNFKVVKAFVARVRDRAVDRKVLDSLTPAQQVVGIVRDELLALFGEQRPAFGAAGRRPQVVLLIGLQGSGKTTTAAKLAHWLRGLPLLHKGRGVVMTHAGIPHIWSLKQARRRAREVEAVLGGDGYRKFFRAMYGNEPAVWSKSLEGIARQRVIVNYFTRMRFVNAAGELEFLHKGPSENAPRGFRPWFEFPPHIRRPIVFGHWASLEGVHRKRAIGVDTGCVWGRSLTALRLEDGKLLCVGCE